jgi:nicotinamidase-related amidase
MIGKKKRRISIIILSILAVLLVCLAIFGARLFYLTSATKGDVIAKYENPKSALLVIDIQNDTLAIPQYSNKDTLMSNINEAVEYANNNGIEVIYIKQEYGSNPLDALLSGGLYRTGSKGAQLSERLIQKPVNIFSKTRSDAFSTSQFEEYLISKQIDTLYIVGADATACVYKTALGAVNRGYKVIALKDCIFALNENYLNKMVNKYIENDIDVKLFGQVFK